ncbi:hypothetical protein GQ54DRAFT_295441 [Martensiomyces pterosporus]|nr:hypothetical protein GQ54DRAFT_295441 [Martensiomyces pterosporus]
MPRQRRSSRGKTTAAAATAAAAKKTPSVPEGEQAEPAKEIQQNEGEPSENQPERMKTRQDTNPERKLALQRLMDAIREGGFDTDLDTSDSSSDGGASKAAPMTRAKEAKLSRRRRQSRPKKTQTGNDSDSDYVQTMEEEEEEMEDDMEIEEEQLDLAKDADEKETQMKETETEMETEREKERERRRKKKEQRLTLKFKVANLMKAGAEGDKGGSREEELSLEDIDWSDFDIETINEILARREELRKRRRREAGNGKSGDQEITTAKLKKSSLAPAPLQLERVKHGEPTNVEQGEVGTADYDTLPLIASTLAATIDSMAERLNSGGAMDVEAEGEEPEFTGLFEDSSEVPQTPGASLHLPPRASAMSQGAAPEDDQVARSGEPLSGARQGVRPHPALIRPVGDTQSGATKDMRIVLQYELKREESLLKDLHAEIADKLFKLQTEEKLLRLIVKRDFQLPEDEVLMDEANAHAIEGAGFGAFAGVEGQFHVSIDAGQGMGLNGMDVDAQHVDEGEESDGTLSGMSSSSSEDEVQDDEIARGALSRVLTQYLPESGTWPEN